MHRLLRLAAAPAVVAALLLAGSAARADTTDARALDLFEKSEAAYERGRFADAIALLRESYALQREPVLLYNMGRAYEGLGELEAAAQSYEAYLKAQPGTPDRGALERRISTLRGQLAEKEALRRKALEGDRGPTVRRPSPVPWLVAGAGAAGIVAGSVIGVLASQRNNDAKAEPTYVEADRLQREGESFATAANVCFVAGGVVLVAGVIWGILDVSAAKTRVAPRGITSLGTFVF